MKKPPKVFYTPPPGASLPPGYSPPPSVSPSPGPSPALSPSPGASPEASPVVSPEASASPSVEPSIPPAFPNPQVSQEPQGATLPSPAPTPTPAGQTPKVRVNADMLRSDRTAGVTTFRGNVAVDYGQVSLRSEELSVNQREKVIFTDTRFTLAQPDPKQPQETQVITGTGLRYNYETREATVNSANLSFPAEYPGQTVYVRAKTLKGYGSTRFEASDAVFSTCKELLQEEVPHYHVETKYLQYFADDKIVAWDNKIYINGRYVFWLPVWVIPLKGERNTLNIGRSEIEGFWIRSSYDYALPALREGFWLNTGRLIGNAFERKGLGLGFEHNATWGYDAATYAFFYGLPTPDNSNLLPPAGSGLDAASEASLIARNQRLFNLSGTFFQDRQFGFEHKHRLPWEIELTARFRDDNIYDPVTPNYRINRQETKLEVKDRIEQLGSLSYDLAYDGSNNRGQQVPTDPGGVTRTISLNESPSDQYRGNLAFKALNTDFRVNSTTRIQQQITREVAPAGTFEVQQVDESGLPTEFDVRTREGRRTTQISNNYNAATTWGPETRSTLTVPHTINITTEAPPTPGPPGSAPLPTPSPSPWQQQVQPQFEVTHRFPDAGTLQMRSEKTLDLTEPAPNLTPQQLAEQLARQNRIDRLPEFTYSSETFFPELQPVSAKTYYGRFYEFAALDPALVTGPFNRFFPGEFINRAGLEASLNSKGHPVLWNSKLDFGGTGYRQFVYSTRDAQYSIDQRARLTTDWAEGIQSNFNYTNNVTPDPDELPPGSREFNNSPFQFDRLSLSKQTRLTGDVSVRRDPFFNWALRGGYDYQNLLYDNLSSEVTWRSRLFGLPFGVSLNGQFNPVDEPGLKFLQKDLDIRYLPRVPLFGIDGRWEPVTGTFTLRSTEDVFGGIFGSDKILPGWQLDNQLGYNFETGLWQSLNNRLYITFGNRWQNHLQVVVGGYYDTQEKEYRFSQVGITKDLHDFVLSANYDRLQSFYSISLTMVAFPNQPLNFSSNTFDRRTGAGGSGFGGF